MKKVIVILFCALSLFFTVGVAKGEVSGEAYVVSILPQMEIKRECLYTEEEMVMAEYIIQQEVRGASIEHKRIIAQVILNRVKHSSFPNSISGVIYQPGAFTAVSDGQINVPIDQNSTIYKACRDAMNGWDPTGGAIYYFNPDTATSSWIWSRPLIKQIGKHRFCS